MKTLKSVLYIAIVLLASVRISFAQGIEEEIGFVYVKAEYLFSTNRYEDAIGEFTKVINQDPKFKDALMYRGISEFMTGKTEAAHRDAIKSIELNGIQAGSASLLGRTFASMKDYEAAINSMTAAIALDNKNSDLYMWRAGWLEQAGRLTQACQDYSAALANGNQEAGSKVKSLCGGVSSNPVKTTPTVPTTRQPEGNPKEVGDNEVLSDGQREGGDDNTVKNTETEPTAPIANVPSEDNTVNKFDIDSDLSIEISGQELGHRKIEEIPSIIILADENGKVTINICVNKDGVVTKAEYNAGNSTVSIRSLVSLAIQKAKQFEFEKGKYDSQCGTMVFNIKGN
jgi:tetratricopeptide (TPR) repeat protein